MVYVMPINKMYVGTDIKLSLQIQRLLILSNISQYKITLNNLEGGDGYRFPFDYLPKCSYFHLFIFLIILGRGQPFGPSSPYLPSEHSNQSHSSTYFPRYLFSYMLINYLQTPLPKCAATTSHSG